MAAQALATAPRLLASAAARGQALRLLARARVAGRRLEDPSDAEALHDFRVALRRLRGWLRESRRVLPTPGHLRRGLRRLGRSTNAARDAEVQLALLREGGASSGLADALWREAREGRERARAAARDFAVPARDLDRVLRGTPARGPSFGTFAAARVAELSEEFARTLERLDPRRGRRAHAARISGKRLRYFLEALPASEPVLAPLRRLQDLLGELRDLKLLRRRIQDQPKPESRAPALLGRLEAVRKRRVRLWREVEAWLARRERLLSRLGRAARAFAVTKGN